MNKIRGESGKLRAQAVSVLSLLAIMLVSLYQNCAPPSSMVTPASGPNNVSNSIGSSPTGEIVKEEPLPVHVIDPLKESTNVSFVESSKDLSANTNSVSVHGICSEKQDGATLAWQLFDNNGQQLDSGFVDCVMSGFQIDLVNLQNLPCNVASELRAQLGAGAPGIISLRRACAQ